MHGPLRLALEIGLVRLVDATPAGAFFRVVTQA